MNKEQKPTTKRSKERAAELLKERIYATLALLAVLISIDTRTSTPAHAEFIVFGTIVSLWAASIVAALMSRRLIYQNEIDHSRERQEQLRIHAPMLAPLAFPMFLILLSVTKVITLSQAINVAIISTLLLLVGWSILSARAFKDSKLPTLLLAGAELAIGLAIVGLKVLIEH